MSPTTILIIYCLLILLASLVGGWIPLLVKLTHKRMELAVSFVAGVMLGVGLLHMLPHAIQLRMEGLGDLAPERAWGEHGLAHTLTNPVILWLLAGFLVMFFIERFFCFHHHEAPGLSAVNEHHDHSHHQAVHTHVPAHTHAPTKHHLTWTGAAIGLSVHSLIEGVALAASIEAGREHAAGPVPLGLATFLVIVLHKPFDSLTLGALLGLGNHTTGLRHLVNAAFSLLIPLGVALFYLGFAKSGDGHVLVSSALAFSAGTFLCIAMSDLLPELQFHQHDRGKLSAALLSGLAIAWVIGVLESRMNQHDHGGIKFDQTSSHDHDHD